MMSRTKPARTPRSEEVARVGMVGRLQISPGRKLKGQRWFRHRAALSTSGYGPGNTSARQPRKSLPDYEKRRGNRLPNPNKRKGDQFERNVCDYLRHNGFPGAERTAQATNATQPTFTWTRQSVSRPERSGKPRRCEAPDGAEWITELREAGRQRSRRCGIPDLETVGVADPGEQLAVMPLAEFAVLLRSRRIRHAPAMAIPVLGLWRADHLD